MKKVPEIMELCSMMRGYLFPSLDVPYGNILGMKKVPVDRMFVGYIGMKKVPGKIKRYLFLLGNADGGLAPPPRAPPTPRGVEVSLCSPLGSRLIAGGVAASPVSQREAVASLLSDKPIKNKIFVFYFPTTCSTERFLNGTISQRNDFSTERFLNGTISTKRFLNGTISQRSYFRCVCVV